LSRFPRQATVKLLKYIFCIAKESKDVRMVGVEKKAVYRKGLIYILEFKAKVKK
jgi:hypothetical protein